MAEAREVRTHNRVVRPIAAGGGRTCARPGCPALAHATLVFAYEAKTARMVALLPERDPAAYDLCTTHADRTSPPFGWSLADERPAGSGEGPVDLADEDRTVAVISAALRAVPTPTDPPATEPAVGPVADDPVADDPVADEPAAEEAVAEGGAPTAGRPVPAAVPRSGTGDAVGADEDTRALVAAAEQLAGAEVEVALEELTELDAAAAARLQVRARRGTGQDRRVTALEREPAVWRVAVDAEPGDDRLVSLTLPFDAADVDGVDPDAEPGDELDEDATLTPEGAAQVW